MIKKGAESLNWGFWGAYQGGHQELVKWMIELVANPSSCYRNKHSHSL